MALITAEFVETRMAETFTATETAQVEALIDDASAEVLLVGDDEWTSVTVPDTVKSVVYQMVRRAYTNPDGYRSEQIGDYQYSRDGSLSSGGMFMTREERAKVKHAAGKANVTTVGVRRPNAYERQWVTDLLQQDDLTL